MKSLLLLLLAAVLTFATPVSAEPIRLQRLIALAIENDPMLAGFAASGRALRDEAVAAGELPDPTLSLSVANLPTDSFDFAQEPMTQVVVGVTQAFPAGDTRSLRRYRLQGQYQLAGLQAEIRQAEVRRQMTASWLKLREAILAIEAIASQRQRFDHLLLSTRSAYESTIGGLKQQDVIRAQLEVARLEERILRMEEQADRAREQLAMWVPREYLAAEMDWHLPSTAAVETAPEDLLVHPEVAYIDQQIAVARTDRRLAAESRRPGYRVSASYGYRDEDFTGRQLPDFVSLGVAIDLPFFTANRQDRRESAAAEAASALESERSWKLKALRARRADARVTITRLEARQRLYQEQLLARHDAVTAAALDAYSSAAGGLEDVMRAYIDGMDARIELLALETRLAMMANELDYLGAAVDSTKPDRLGGAL